MRISGPGGLALLAACAGALTFWVAPSAASGGAGHTRYAKVRRLCAQPAPGRASCFALRLKAARANTPGVEPYVTAAGSRSKGPAGGLTPGDLASAYAFSPSAGGAGQTVGIVDAFNDPKIEADLATFDVNYGLPACTSSNGCFTKVGQTGSTSSLPGDDTTGWSAEISLDVETVHSVCPNCKIVLVEADSESDADLGAAADEAVALGADELSNSYGSPEGEAEDPAPYDHPGVVVVASAGDSGYYDWDFAMEGLTAPAQPDAPASYPTVVAVGGTSLKLSGRGARKSETVWNDSGRPNSQGTFRRVKQFAATGGGCSLKFTAPAWQQDAADWSATGCGGFRLASDVSAVADPYTGFDVYDSYAYEAFAETGWMTFGGTSLSAPLISALYALAGGSHTVSYPAQTLYAQLGNPAALYDVSSGGNGYCDGAAPSECGEPAVNEELGPVDCLGTSACDATPGFDGPSGVGAPIGLAAFGGPVPEAEPTVVTGHASPVERESAVLNATVNPNGANVTACRFEYGPGTTITQSVACSSLPGSGTSPVAVSAQIGSLSRKTAYRFRISASSGGGTSVGKAKKLKTH